MGSIPSQLSEEQVIGLSDCDMFPEHTKVMVCNGLSCIAQHMDMGERDPFH